jgi:hypothetical protein
MSDESILILRQAQLETLGEAATDDFVARAVSALQPWPSSGAGRSVHALAAARTWVREGIEHARRWEIRSERDVIFFLTVRRRCGDEFDVDPVNVWAREILAGERRHATRSKAELLLAASERFT